MVTKHKQPLYVQGSFGRLLVIGGNAQFGGAIILTGSTAVYSGTGLCPAIFTNFANLRSPSETAVIIFKIFGT